MCCSTRLRGSVPHPQSSSLALPCQILVSVDGCQSLAAFGSCIHRMRAPSRRPITPAGTVGKRVPSGGHNRRRRLATRRCDTKRAGTTVVVPATIEWQQCLLHLHFFDTLRPEDFSSGLNPSMKFTPPDRHDEAPRPVPAGLSEAVPEEASRRSDPLRPAERRPILRPVRSGRRRE